MRWLVFFLMGVSVSVWAEPSTEVPSADDCREPDMMIVPDGHKVSSNEMLKAQQNVETYIEETQVFLECLLTTEKAQGEAMTFEEKKDSIMRYNLAVARLEGLVESFNQQLRAYKKTNAN